MVYKIYPDPEIGLDMNTHLKVLLEEMMKRSKPDLQARITKVFQQYVAESQEDISTMKYKEIMKKVMPALRQNDEILSRISGYNMVSYDRASIVHILRTKYQSGLTLKETAEQFGVSKNTILNWQKKLKNDPEMMKEVRMPLRFQDTI